MGRKSLKGAVSVEKDGNRIRLRWRYLSRRYSLNLFSFNKVNLAEAKKVALCIEQEMVQGNFDPTLNRYRNQELPLSSKSFSTVHLFEEWVKQYKNMDCDQHKNYHTVRNMLRRWGNFTLSEVLQKLNNENLSATTYNRRLTMMKSFMLWLVKQEVMPKNPLEDVQPRKKKKTSNPKRHPLTEQEIKKILDAFQRDTFCPKSSRFKHSHYYPFVYFVLKTGVRNAEAIGLRVEHVHVKKKLIEIKEVMARSFNGTHSAARIRKETKNGKVRLLPYSPDLAQVIKPLLTKKQKDDLVFCSPKGLAIDDRMFQRRIFKKVLQGLGIEERVLYACRHTFGSRCIDNGLSPVMTAFLMGNSPETVLKDYTHQISIPKDLPWIT